MASYEIPERSPKQVAKGAAVQAQRIACLGHYKNLKVRAVPMKKWSSAEKSEVPHPERVKLEFYVPPGEDGKETVLSNRKLELPLSILFGLFGPGGNHTDTYNAEQNQNPFATNETVATSTFGSGHKYIYSFSSLPVTKEFYESKFPDKKHGEWRVQHDEFYSWLQLQVNQIIVDLVKRR